MGTLHFIKWLKLHLDKKTFDGCKWTDKECQEFVIKWPRADRNTGADKLGIMNQWWRHKFGNTKANNSPTLIKGNFRSCLNSKIGSKEIKKVQKDYREGNDDWKVYQFQQKPSAAQGTPVSPSANIGAEDPYLPNPAYTDSFIESELQDVKNGFKVWNMRIKAYGRGNEVLLENTFNFSNLDEGRKPIHVYLGGSDSRRRIRYFDTYFPQLKDRILHWEVPRPKEMAANLAKLFEFGFIMEMDPRCNIYITRLTSLHVFYGHPGVQETWQKLAMIKKAEEYAYPRERSDAKKEMVFSYEKFVYIAHYYEKCMEDDVEPVEKKLPDYQIILPVHGYPPIGAACGRHCDLYFEIDHIPAKKRLDTISKRLYNPSFNKISEDPMKDEMDKVADGVGNMDIAYYPPQSYYSQQSQPQPSPGGISVSSGLHDFNPSSVASNASNTTITNYEDQEVEDPFKTEQLTPGPPGTSNSFDPSYISYPPADISYPPEISYPDSFITAVPPQDPTDFANPGFNQFGQFGPMMVDPQHMNYGGPIQGQAWTTPQPGYPGFQQQQPDYQDWSQ